MKGYENDTVWKKVQEFLPEENRLNADNLPKEEWMKFDEKIIHVDYYSAAEEKGVVIIYHGVGGNGRRCFDYSKEDPYGLCNENGGGIEAIPRPFRAEGRFDDGEPRRHLRLCG